jgi:signal transduction histidine kinase
VAESGVELVAEAPHDLVLVDQDKLLRVLQNLVNNAVEALGRTGGHITIRGVAVEGGHDITVSDDGPGIPETIRERLFQPFVTHGKTNGTGLGMAITKSIVEAHKGRISFTTKSGVGTTFRIFLPS